MNIRHLFYLIRLKRYSKLPYRKGCMDNYRSPEYPPDIAMILVEFLKGLVFCHRFQDSGSWEYAARKDDRQYGDQIDDSEYKDYLGGQHCAEY